MNAVMANMELIVAALVVAFTTALATDYVHLPFALFASPFATAAIVIVSIGAFTVYPAIGLAMFFFAAVLFFKRNVYSMIASAQTTYGKNSIRAQPHVDAVPNASMRSGPRQYEQFDETDTANPMIGPVMEAFEPAPYGDEQGAPVDGQFPTDEDRTSADPVTESYIYRPDEDTGSNEFKRYGPDLDEKAPSFAY